MLLFSLFLLLTTSIIPNLVATPSMSSVPFPAHDLIEVFHFDAHDDSMITPSSIICYIGKLYAFCDLCSLYQLQLPATLMHNKSICHYPLQT